MRVLLHIDATAGWGKTTAIERDIKKYAEITSGWRGDKALYLVFTKKNVYSARKRLSGYVYDQMIRTLHSYCYSFTDRRPVLDGKLLKEFSDRYSYGDLSSGMFFTPKSRGDYLLALYYWARNTETEIDEAIETMSEELSLAGIEKDEGLVFYSRWEFFKREKGAMDYADILEESEPSFEGWYLALDEAQDCTPLMWKAFEKIILNSPSLRKVVIVGDCDQTIYRFQGSDPQTFLLFPQVLADRHGFKYVKWDNRNISRRVPSVPLSFALKFLEKIKHRNHEKEILPAREGGKVMFMDREEFLKMIEMEKRSVVVQERHRHNLLWWKKRLEMMGVPYTLSPEDYKRYKAWESLMEEKPFSHISLWTLFKDYLPDYQTFLRDHRRYLDNFYRNKEKWVDMLDEKTRLYAFSYPREPVHLTTMHSHKGGEGDIVWVSGNWTKRIYPSDEERRVYFTACTRTKDILVIARDGWSRIKTLL